MRGLHARQVVQESARVVHVRDSAGSFRAQLDEVRRVCVRVRQAPARDIRRQRADRVQLAGELARPAPALHPLQAHQHGLATRRVRGGVRDRR